MRGFTLELVEKAARAISNAADIDPDVFIGMHGRAAWEKQFFPQALAALEVSAIAEFTEMLTRVRDELEGDGYSSSALLGDIDALLGKGGEA